MSNVLKDIPISVRHGEVAVARDMQTVARDTPEVRVEAAWAGIARSGTSAMARVIGRGEVESFSSSEAATLDALTLGEALTTQLLDMDDSDTEDFQEFKRRLGH